MLFNEFLSKIYDENPSFRRFVDNQVTQFWNDVDQDVRDITIELTEKIVQRQKEYEGEVSYEDNEEFYDGICDVLLAFLYLSCH